MVEAVPSPCSLELGPPSASDEVPAAAPGSPASAGAAWLATRQNMSSERSCHLWVHLPVVWKYREMGKSGWDFQLAASERAKGGWWRSTAWPRVGDPKWELSCWAGGVAVVESVPNPSPFELGPALAAGEVPGRPALLVELRRSPRLRSVVPRVDLVIDDIKRKLAHLAKLDSEESLGTPFEPNALGAVLGSTHDLLLPGGERRGNLHHECCEAIRTRSGPDRGPMLETWGVFLHFLREGLDALPAFEGVGFRCLPERCLPTEDEYSVGSFVQWDALASIATGAAGFDAAKAQAVADDSVILKLTLTRARVLGPVAFFPFEGEVVVYPLSKFKVAAGPYQRDGFTCFDLEQQAEDASSAEAWVG